MRPYRKLERLATAPQRSAACSVLLSLLVAALTVACGSSSHVSSENSSDESSGGVCASLSPSRYFAGARVVFMGTMLAGRTADLGGHRVLVSPARVRVTRYLKGSGPDVVSVATGVTRDGSVVNEDGIQPLAGQHWKIYTRSQRMPYQTSVCDGTRAA